MRAAGIAGAIALVLGTAGPAIAHPWAERRAEVVEAFGLEPIGEPVDDALTPAAAHVIGRRVRILEREHAQWAANMAELERQEELEEQEVVEVAVASSAPGCGAACIDCESGGDPNAWNAAGYWGLYQFDRSTWAAHGGDPGRYGSASASEQHAVASRITYDAWPNC